MNLWARICILSAMPNLLMSAGTKMLKAVTRMNEQTSSLDEETTKSGYPLTSLDT